MKLPWKLKKGANPMHSCTVFYVFTNFFSSGFWQWWKETQPALHFTINKVLWVPQCLIGTWEMCFYYSILKCSPNLPTKHAYYPKLCS